MAAPSVAFLLAMLASSPASSAAEPPALAVADVAAPAERVRAVGPTTAAEPTPPEPSGRRPHRRGALVGLGLGYVGCETEECDWSEGETGVRFVGGALGQVELGYRVGRIAPVVSAGMGAGPLRLRGELAGAEASMRFVDADAGLLLFPVAQGRIDPYFGVRLGYARARTTLGVPGTDATGTITYSRLGVRLSAGLGIHLGSHLSLGPRFDMTLPFAGSVCNAVSGLGLMSESCVEASDLADDARSELPRWWSATLQLHVVLPTARRRS